MRPWSVRKLMKMILCELSLDVGKKVTVQIIDWFYVSHQFTQRVVINILVAYKINGIMTSMAMLFNSITNGPQTTINVSYIGPVVWDQSAITENHL